MKLSWILAGVGLGLTAYLILNPPNAPEYATGSEDVEGAAVKTAGWGTKQRAKGTGGDLLGKVKEGVGNITGNNDLANEGAVDQVIGKVKDTAGQVAQAAGSAIHDLNK